MIWENIIDKILLKQDIRKRNKIINQLIKPKELVLEVGSGSAPMKRSTVLLDKFVCTIDIHRTNKQSINQFHGKPFILADGNKLPFKDKSFDTIICRHVIEHVDNPLEFLKELQRVGKKGYIEFPSIFCELIRGGFGNQVQIRDMFPAVLKKHLADIEHGTGTPGHKWFIAPIKNRLYFVAKNKELYPLYLIYGAYAKSRENKKYVRKLLGNRISYITWSPDKPIDGVFISDNVTNDVSKSLNEKYKVLNQIDFLEKTVPENIIDPLQIQNIKKILCCHLCRDGELIVKTKWLHCSRCNRKYPVINGVPVMIDQVTD